MSWLSLFAMAEAAPSTSLFPLHRLVWSNRYQELDKAMGTKEHDKEAADPRGR